MQLPQVVMKDSQLGRDTGSRVHTNAASPTITSADFLDLPPDAPTELVVERGIRPLKHKNSAGPKNLITPFLVIFKGVERY